MIERIFREEVVGRSCRVTLCSKSGERAALPLGESISVGDAMSSDHVGHATEFRPCATMDSMATTSKPTDVLDAMLGHVRYEAVKAINFLSIGNGWCAGLPAELAPFARESVLEAGLVHFRCLIEFLDAKPEGSQVMARDYVKDWDWTISGGLVKVGELHGRVAHLGTIRATVDEEGAFEWSTWLDEHAPKVLGAFRDFLRRLRDVNPFRFAELDRGDLLDALDRLLGA